MPSYLPPLSACHSGEEPLLLSDSHARLRLTSSVVSDTGFSDFVFFSFNIEVFSMTVVYYNGRPTWCKQQLGLDNIHVLI